MTQRYSQIVSTGMYLPPNECPNDVLRDRFDEVAPEFVDKMEASGGIRTRFYANDDQATSDLAVEAGRRALERAGVAPEDVDLVIVGTDSPDYITPSTSVVVQDKLGAKKAGTFDIGCACASFPTALATANGLMATNPGLKNVLVIGAYLMHRLADPADPAIFFYGDGAGAALVQPSEKPGLHQAAFLADGSYAKRWLIQAGGTVEPASEEAVRAGRIHVRMLDRYPPEVNDVGWPTLVQNVCAQLDWRVQDLDQVIFTQVRKGTIEKVMGTLELPMERTHTIMEKWGYTGSACIPMALHDAIDAGKVNPGDKVVLVGSGVGYNQAAVAFEATGGLIR